MLYSGVFNGHLNLKLDAPVRARSLLLTQFRQQFPSVRFVLTLTQRTIEKEL